ARPRRRELALLVAPAGDVVLKEAAGPAAQVVAGEQGHHDEALEGGGEVAADHLGQLVGLALDGQLVALDLLVVLELQLEELDHLDGRAGGPGDGDARVAVGREDLLHRPVRDQVAAGGPAVAGHHHAVGELQGHHGGAVGDLVRRQVAGQVAPVGLVSRPAQHLEEGRSGIVVGSKDRQGHWAGGYLLAARCRSPHPTDRPPRARSAPRRRRSPAPGSRGSVRVVVRPGLCSRRCEVLLPTLLDVAVHELLGVGLQHAVDLVQQVVELGLDLLAVVGGGGRLLDDLLLLLASGGGLLLHLTLSHAPAPRLLTGPTGPTTQRSSCSRQSTYPPAPRFHVSDPSSGPGAAGRRRRRRPSSPSWRRRSPRPTSAGTCPGTTPGCPGVVRSPRARPRRRR